MTKQLTLTQFVTCFRKQFQFQTGTKIGAQQGRYFTAYNNERGLKNDQWGMMCFAHLAPKYGLHNYQICLELEISKSHLLMLQEETPKFLAKDADDQLLRNTMLNKIGLVKNCIGFTHRVWPKVEV